MVPKLYSASELPGAFQGGQVGGGEDLHFSTSRGAAVADRGAILRGSSDSTLDVGRALTGGYRLHA